MRFVAILGVCSFGFAITGILAMMIVPPSVQSAVGAAAVTALCQAVVCGTVLVVREVMD